MAKTTSLILGSHFEAYIQERVESGAHASASEVIREALFARHVGTPPTHYARARTS